jgi:hypothetical protein
LAQEIARNRAADLTGASQNECLTRQYFAPLVARFSQ